MRSSYAECRLAAVSSHLLGHLVLSFLQPLTEFERSSLTHLPFADGMRRRVNLGKLGSGRGNRMATRKKKIGTNNESVLTHQHEGPLTIGIDRGDRLSHYCILTGDGDVLMEGRLQSTPAAFHAQFASLPATLIALEVRTHSRWVSSLLADIGHEVVVANASQVHLIHKSSRRTKLMPGPWPGWRGWILRCCRRFNIEVMRHRPICVSFALDKP